MKAFGLLGAFIALLASMAAIGLQIESWPHTLGDVRSFVTHLREAANPAIWGSIIFDLLACLAWAFAVTDAWVKAGAEQYAEFLLATMDRS